MYGLPKIHKQDVPLRPILSMTGSAQHQLAQWLTSVIDPVLSLYSTYCISDSFTFTDKVKTFNFPPSVFLCFYDVCSLFTNVPLAETIEICANALYDGELTLPPFPRAVFVELMQTATSSAEFSFNNIMHRQIDGVAMGSPLGPSLANIFVGYYKALLFKRVNKPLMYYRYVDDTFAVFNDEDECNEFFSHLNSLHPLLRFTFEKECNRTLPFLDVRVEKNDHEFVTSTECFTILSDLKNFIKQKVNEIKSKFQSSSVGNIMLFLHMHYHAANLSKFFVVYVFNMGPISVCTGIDANSKILNHATTCICCNALGE